MSKYKAKMTENSDSVSDFIMSVPDQQKQEDSFALLKIMEACTGLKPRMWGTSIIGFGSYHYQYESGHEGDSPLIGFSPRKAAIVLYMGNFDQKESMLKDFGKHTTSKACIYFKKLKDINVDTLKKMIPLSIAFAKSSC